MSNPPNVSERRTASAASHLTPLDLDRLRTRLLADLETTAARSRPTGDESDTQASETDVHGALNELTGDACARIRDALARIEDGTYGLCTSCQDPIPVARLDVIPDTTSCVACQGGRSRTGR